LKKGMIAFDKSFHTHWSKQFHTISIVHCTMLMMPFTEKDKEVPFSQHYKCIKHLMRSMDEYPSSQHYKCIKHLMGFNGWVPILTTWIDIVCIFKLVDISCTIMIHDCFPCSCESFSTTPW
jgi:hypothetical protein